MNQSNGINGRRATTTHFHGFLTLMDGQLMDELTRFEQPLHVLGIRPRRAGHQTVGRFALLVFATWATTAGVCRSAESFPFGDTDAVFQSQAESYPTNAYPITTAGSLLPGGQSLPRDSGRDDAFSTDISYLHNPSNRIGQPIVRSLSFHQPSADSSDTITQPSVEELPGTDTPAGQLGTDPPSNEIAEAESLGQAPEDYSLQFLRRVTVLLRPGQWQVDVGLTYIITEEDFPDAINFVGPVFTLVGEARVRQRLLVVPLAVRYGWTEQTQLFVNAPIGWSSTEIVLLDTDSIFDNFPDDEFGSVGGIGDVSAGFTTLLLEKCGDLPDVIFTLGFTAPTGNASLDSLIIPRTDAVLGDGFWAVFGNLLFIHTYDPLVVFYGFGSRYRFENDFLNPFSNQPDLRDHVEPGFEINYSLGVGFAVNDRVTLSTVYFGQYIDADEINNRRIEGSILEPHRLRFSATIARRDKLVEPFAEIGMTDDAPSSRVGVIWTF